MKLAKKEFIIGLCVIVSIVILYFGIEYLKGVNLFKPANYYVAHYENVAGLELAAPVTIDGYKVGQVRDIRFNYEKPGDVEVVLALNKNLRVPEDSYATLASTLLSGAYVEIKLGKSQKLIEIGGDIGTRHVPDLMASVSDELLPSVMEVIPRIDTLLYNLNLLVANPALTQSINRLDGISDNLLTSSMSLNGTLKRDIPLVMRNANFAMQNLDTISVNLAELSCQLKNLPLSATIDNVNAVTANLTKFSENLNNEKSSLGLLMNDPELYNRFNRVAADVDSLIVDIKRNPKRYISIKLL